jgi:16S rRNA processing protein RimM
MLRKDCYLLGKVTKIRGYKGELVFFLDVTDPLEYQFLESVYIDLNDMLTPFFIQQIKLQKNNRAHVIIEGINSEEEAQALVGKSLFLPLTTLSELTDTSFYDHEIVGFGVTDEEYGFVGKAQQVIDLPNNPLLQIDAEGIEVLIPIKNDTVVQIDRNNHKLVIQTPPELIDLYLGSDSSSKKSDLD